MNISIENEKQKKQNLRQTGVSFSFYPMEKLEHSQRSSPLGCLSSAARYGIKKIRFSPHSNQRQPRVFNFEFQTQIVIFRYEPVSGVRLRFF